MAKIIKRGKGYVTYHVGWRDYVYEMMRAYDALDHKGRVEMWENLLNVGRMADEYLELKGITNTKD